MAIGRYNAAHGNMYVLVPRDLARLKLDLQPWRTAHSKLFSLVNAAKSCCLVFFSSRNIPLIDACWFTTQGLKLPLTAGDVPVFDEELKDRKPPGLCGAFEPSAIFLIRRAIDISMLSLTRYASGWKIA